MELFRLVAFGLLVFGSVAFSQGVEAVPERSQNKEVDVCDESMLKYFDISPEHVMGCQLVEINLDKQMQKRALGGNLHARKIPMSFRAFGENIKRWLYPRDSLFASTETPVYFAYKNNAVRGKVSFVRQPDAMRKVGQLYEDTNHYASVIIGRDPHNDEQTIRGKLRSRRDNATLVIGPLPKKFVEEHLKKHRSIDGNNHKSFLISKRHIVMKIKENPPNSNISEGALSFIADEKTTDTKENMKIATPSFQGLNKENSNISFDPSDVNNTVDYSGSIYPKIFVTIDSSYWSQNFLWSKSEDSRMINLLEYVLAFWNSVDLSYRHFKNPNIRFHISGIAIAMSPAATPYLFNSRIKEYGTIDSEAAIDKAQRFYYAVGKQIPSDMYNIAVTMTQLKFDDSTIGVASDGSICLKNARRKKYGVALVHDDGAFRGIDTAAHEVGHTFGLKHDEDAEHPACNGSQSSIMGVNDYRTENSSMFSACSLAQFNAILEKGGLKCLYAPPQEKFRNLPKPMPGKILNLDQQCQALNYTKACGWPTTDPCVRISCTTEIIRTLSILTERCEELDHGAAPGTPCGDGKEAKFQFCLQSRCINLN